MNNTTLIELSTFANDVLMEEMSSGGGIYTDYSSVLAQIAKNLLPGNTLDFLANNVYRSLFSSEKLDFLCSVISLIEHILKNESNKFEIGINDVLIPKHDISVENIPVLFLTNDDQNNITIVLITDYAKENFVVKENLKNSKTGDNNDVFIVVLKARCHELVKYKRYKNIVKLIFEASKLLGDAYSIPELYKDYGHLGVITAFYTSLKLSNSSIDADSLEYVFEDKEYGEDLKRFKNGILYPSYDFEKKENEKSQPSVHRLIDLFHFTDSILSNVISKEQCIDAVEVKKIISRINHTNLIRDKFIRDTSKYIDSDIQISYSKYGEYKYYVAVSDLFSRNMVIEDNNDRNITYIIIANNNDTSKLIIRNSLYIIEAILEEDYNDDIASDKLVASLLVSVLALQIQAVKCKEIYEELEDTKYAEEIKRFINVLTI